MSNKFVSDSIINVQDPALVSRKRVYPDVLLRNRKITNVKNVVNAKSATFVTDEFDTTVNKYVEIYDTFPGAAGNTGELQFNNVAFDAISNLKWDETTNTLFVVGNVQTTTNLITNNIIGNNVTFTTNSYSWTFANDGQFILPNYTLPLEKGDKFQTLITNGNGILSWQTVASGFDTITVLDSSTGTVIHDFTLGQVFFHTNILSNFTTNIINLNLENNFATNIHIILDQNSIGRITSALQINGVAQTINWVGGILPVPNENLLEIISFSILRVNSIYTIYAQLISYG